MASNRLSNALSALGEGLSTIAKYRGAKEEIAEQRAHEDKVRASQNAFQERLLGLGQAHSEKMLGKQQEFSRSEREAGQLFEMDKFNAQMAQSERHFAAEMSARWAGIKQAGASQADARSDRDLSRKLKVFELGMSTAASQYESTIKQMQEEMGALAKDPMLKMDPKQLQAAQEEVRERYSGQLREHESAIDENMGGYAELVGMGKGKVDIGPMQFSEVESGSQSSAPASASGGQAGSSGGVDRTKVAEAVENARSQLGAAANYPDSKLKAAFIASGLNDQEAALAVRQMKFSSVRNTDGMHYQK